MSCNFRHGFKKKDLHSLMANIATGAPATKGLIQWEHQRLILLQAIPIIQTLRLFAILFYYNLLISFYCYFPGFVICFRHEKEEYYSSN